DDAILTPQAEDLATEPHDEEVLSLDEELRPAAAPPPSIPLPPKKKASRAEAITISDEIEIEDAPAPRAWPHKAIATPPPPAAGGAQPIADLLSSEAEEEVELLSISSDEAVVERHTEGHG